jgi:hypothetical protein
MRPSLIVFIDCFPRDVAGDWFLPELPGRSAVRPGFGYSVNIVAELFAGTTPDDLGYFNLFQYEPENRWLRRAAPALRLLSPLRLWYLADRVAHRLVSRRWGFAGNIPFRYIGWFEPAGVYPFSPAFGRPTLFHAPAFDGGRVFHSDLKGVRPPHRDRALVDRALAAVRPERSVFLSLSDLDATAHAHGVGSPQFQARAGELDVWLRELVERFRDANPDGYVAVVSDHGASNPHGPFDLGVERRFGPARPGRYVHFLDATLARFWVGDAGLRAEMAAWLGEMREGTLVTEEERAEYGITSRRFGDLVWVVGEGYGISPSFLGRGVSKALHGYHPALPSQQALFVASEPLHAAAHLPREAYRAMRAAAAGSAAPVPVAEAVS